MEKISVFRRLGFKMSLFFSLVGLLPLFFGILILFKSTENFMKSEICNNLGMLAKNTKEEIGRFLGSCVIDMQVLAESNEMRNTDTSVDKRLLEMKKIQDYYRRFEDITLIDAKGRVITSTTYNYRGEWKSKKWFQKAINGNVCISDAHIILDPYKVVIAIAVPLKDEYGKIQAALVGQLNMERVWEIVDQITIGSTGFVTIVNNQNHYIAHPDKEKIFRYAAFDPIKQSGVAVPAEFKSETLLYHSVECSYSLDYAFPKWRIIAAQKKIDALSNILRLKYNVACILGIGLLLVIVASILVSRGIVKPIHILARGMARVSDGDLSFPANIKSSDEIGLLGASFNNMITHLTKARDEIQGKTDALSEAFVKIHELNVTLEKKVTERTKELREKQFQLIQAGKLAAIGQLGAGVAHELNNPIAGILGYTQLMLEKISKENVKAEEVYAFKKYLQYIENGARRSKDIVQNLLQFARKSGETFEFLNVNKIILDTLSLMERQLSANKIVLIKNLGNDIARIHGDANQLQQVFTNIVLNAQQAMPDGGQLLVSTRNNKDAVKIEFQDTGCGIAEEHLERIFEPFFTTKMDWRGTGLGLSICYDIIKNHNGIITVASKVGEGSVFAVVLPVKDFNNGQNNTGKRGDGENTCC